MSLALTGDERATAAGSDGAATAMRIVAEAARLMGAPRLIPIASAHIDGAPMYDRTLSDDLKDDTSPPDTPIDNARKTG